MSMTLNRLLIFMNGWFFTISISAQITINRNADIQDSISKSKTVAEQYDSLSNLQKRKLLKGQTLLYVDNPNRKNYEDAQNGHYYFVESIYINDWGAAVPVMRDIRSNKEIRIGPSIWHPDEEKYFNTRFVVVGHYEKLKQLYVGKDFVYNYSTDIHQIDNFLLTLDGDSINKDIPIGTVFQCIDVQVKPRSIGKTEIFRKLAYDTRSTVILVFDNPIYGKHYAYFESRDGGNYVSDIYFDYSNNRQKKIKLCGVFEEKEVYFNNQRIVQEKANKDKAARVKASTERRKRLIAKYGEQKGSMIAQGKISIGMTKDMCKDAWGQPDDINKTINKYGTREQWVYGRNVSIRKSTPCNNVSVR